MAPRASGIQTPYSRRRFVGTDVLPPKAARSGRTWVNQETTFCGAGSTGAKPARYNRLLPSDAHIRLDSSGRPRRVPAPHQT
jgi:hypothetical protein